MTPVLRGLAANPALPPPSVARLIAAADEDLADVLADRPDLTPHQLRSLTARFEYVAVRLAHEGRLAADDVDPMAQPLAAIALLDTGAADPAWARLLAGAPGAELREKVAACRGLPPDVEDTLAADREVSVVAELALWASRDVAARLAEHPYADVRVSVAANEATPPEVLAALLTGEGLTPARVCLVCEKQAPPFAHASDCAVPDCELPPGAACDGSHESSALALRQLALRNPATPAAAAVAFAGDPSVLLRQELAARTDLPRAVYERLARDPAAWVRAQLADNPAVEEPVLRLLAEDEGQDVRRRLAHHPALPLDLLPRLVHVTRIGPTLLPRIAAASPAEVAGLATSADPAVRALAAERHDLPARVRDALALDRDAKVAKAVAPHPGLSEARLAMMLDRHGTQVAARVAANPGAGPALLARIASARPPAGRALREIARHPAAPGSALVSCLDDSRARRIAAGHPSLPPTSVEALLDNEDDAVVEAAAGNPALPAAAAQAALETAVRASGRVRRG